MKLRDLVKLIPANDMVVIQSYGIYGGKLSEITIAPNDLDREISAVRAFNDELIIMLDI